jgi:hypothetical protein
MAEDLMNTQTGGTGETIQLQPEVQTTPEQFDVKINPPVDSEPIPTQPITPEPQLPIEPPAPVIEEQETIIEGEPVKPPVTREGMAEVSLSDDVDTQSAIQDLGIPTEAPIRPSQIEEPAELDLSGYTIDGAEQSSNIIPTEVEDVEEIQTTPTFETIDLSNFTIDGAEQGLDPEIKNKKETAKKEYANTRVEIDNQGKVKVKPKPKQPEQEADGELYTYKERPGVMYKRKGKNDWYIDTKGNGNFVKITKNAESRIAELEKNAVRVGSEKPKIFTNANQTITKAHGNVNKYFTEYDMLTAGGDRMITKGTNFSELTKSNEPTKSDMYTNSGQINFNYDPNYAGASKEQRALLDMKESKPEGTYRFPGSDALYEKRGKAWFKDSSGTGKNYKPLSKGDIAKREAALEAKAVPVSEYTVSFNVAANIAKTQKLKPEIKPVDVNAVQEIQEKYTFDEAKNFADKDLVQMFAKNQTFSGKQLTDMLELQKQAKQIIGDGNFDPIKGKAVEGLMTDLNEYFDTAKSFNEKVNTAYSKNISLDRLLLEEKRKEYNDILGVSGSTSDFQDSAKETFESTLKMVDFIQDAVDDGKMLFDREKGGFKFSTNTTKTERDYYEKKLGEYLAEHKKVLGTRFESINDEITDLKGTMRGNLARISSIKDKMSKMNSDSSEYKELSKELWSLTSENKQIDKDISNKQSLKSTVFHTEPKKLVASLKPTGSAQVIFNALPENLSSKQKFDLFYKQLLNKNNALEKENNIDGKSLTGKLSQYGRELLDWGGYISLSKEEKEWLDNKSMLNQLSPLYFNNDFGFTETSGGFYDSFVNNFGQLLAPKASKAAGYINQSEAANTIMNTLAEQGFGKDDIVDDNYLKALKEKSNVDFWSREQFGGMLGTTFGIIAPLVVTKKIPASSLRLVGRVENLVTKTKNAENLALFMTRAENVFDSTLKATKYGKYLVNPIKTGLEFEATGRIFGSTQDEMYFLSGFTGGIASEAFAGLVSKMPANKVYSYMKSMFGGQTDKAVNVIKKIGELNARGLGETAEEFGNELSNIYTDELRTKGFFDEVKTQFGDLDRVQEFVISTFIMGAAFGIVDSDKKRAAYDSLSPEKKAQVDEVLNSVKQDMESAEDNVDEYVNEQTEEVERKQQFEKEPQKEVKTDDLGEIQFDAENVTDVSEGRPSVVAESKEDPASFTEPIDLTKLEENAEKDQAGIPGEERKGEEPIETQPVAEAGQETPSPSGVVQEEEKVSQKEIDDYKSSLTRKIEQLQGDEKYSSQLSEYEEELKQINEDPNLFFSKRKIDDEIRNIQIQSDRTRTDLSDKVKSLMDKREALSAQEKKSIFFTKKKELKALDEEIDNALKEMKSLNDKEFEEVSNLRKKQENLDKQKATPVVTETTTPTATEVKTKGPSTEVKTFADRMINGKEITSEKDTKFYEENKEQIDSYINEQEEAQAKVKQTTPATATMFTEATDINKIKNKEERLAAETAYQEKHGVSHKKVSKIDTNFASIVKSLKNNNLIEKEC